VKTFNLYLTKQAVLTIMLIIFQHFEILRIAGYHMTLLLVILPFWILTTFQIGRKYKVESIIWLSFFVFYPFINFYTISSFEEFLKTYLQFILCVLIFFIVYNSRLVVKKEFLLNAIQITQFILVVFLIIQYLMVVKLDQNWLYNPWGSFSWQYALSRDEYNFFRMKGFYLEPSYVAFVMFSLFVCRFLLEGKLTVFNVLLSVCSLFVINSSFGFLAFSVLIPAIIFFTLTRRNRLYFLIATCLIGLLLSPALINSFMSATKLNNLGNEGYTSAYTRWIFPVNLVVYIFSQGFITGYGMGQLDSIISNFDIIIIKSGESGVSNSLASLTIYFGIVSLLLAIYLAVKFYRGEKNKKIFILFFLICLSNTGAFNTIEFFFMSLVLPFTCLKVCSYAPERHHSML
jgi:hypothetical protein